MKALLIGVFLACSFFGCNESTSTTEEPIEQSVDEIIEPNTSVKKTELLQPFSVYNEAYQENFESDTIEDILKEAKDAYILVDPFNDEMGETIQMMQKNKNEVGGYISVGTGEVYREDYTKMKPYLADSAWEEWQDEFFIRRIEEGLLDIMHKRIDTLADLGLDWVEFDNMDWGNEENIKRYDLEITVEQSIIYVNNLCNYAHQKGLKCMAKNSVEGFENFDGVLYESYENEKNWWDIEDTREFLEAGKPVIINHYNSLNCSEVYEFYQSYYKSDKISFICESITTQEYEHF